MDIFEKLPSDDVELIRRYINNYGGSDEENSYMESCEMQHFLRFWSRAKDPLYRMFGEQFILKREVCFEKDSDDLQDEMDEAMRYSDCVVSNFRIEYERTIDKMDLSSEVTYELKRFTRDMYMLVKNIYDGPPIIIPAKHTVDGHPLQINSNCKVSKMLGKICKAIGFSYSMWRCSECGRTFAYTEEPKCKQCGGEWEQIDGYEAFRRAHSLVLNQKMVRGNMCLSIHPLDYITMSDNDSGWDSCMHWVEDPGDYRLGTIEMMNSPYCIVAYVEAKDPWDIYGVGPWNSKRWRQLIMITPEMLLGNKQYPYSNDYLQGTALKWVRELANNFGSVYGPYDEEALQIHNQHHNVIGNRQVYVRFTFNYMYNDIYDLRMAFVKSNFSGGRIEYNLSGEAVCTNCGGIIYKEPDEEVEPSWTICRSCSGMWRCACCGGWHYGEPCYASDSDDPLCDYCYSTETEQCEVCGDRVRVTKQVFIELLPNADEEHETYNWNYYVRVCKNCLWNYPEEFNKLFGEIRSKHDMWGREREVISIDGITNEGMRRGNLDWREREILTAIRDAKSIEDRLSLIRKNLY